jgi:sulfate/thiosulfate transport system ATP-binding protein
VIEARNVTKRFGEFVALDDVSVHVPSGALMALLGPSGSGKSTLLRVIAGLEKPDTGEVFISERDATNLRPQQRGVGFVFQHYAPFKHMTVADNVAFGLTVRRRPKQEIRDRVHELLELVQLEGLGKRYPAQLSGGQRQRMPLARALAVEPEVLLQPQVRHREAIRSSPSPAPGNRRTCRSHQRTRSSSGAAETAARARSGDTGRTCKRRVRHALLAAG